MGLLIDIIEQNTTLPTIFQINSEPDFVRFFDMAKVENLVSSHTNPVVFYHSNKSVDNMVFIETNSEEYRNKISSEEMEETVALKDGSYEKRMVKRGCPPKMRVVENITPIDEYIASVTTDEYVIHNTRKVLFNGKGINNFIW